MPRVCTPWTEAEMRLLRERYPTDGPTVLAEILGRSYHSVQRKAAISGLRSGKNTPPAEEARRKLHQKHSMQDAYRRAMQDPEKRSVIKRAAMEMGKQRRARRREKGLCVRCGKPVIENNTSNCLLHWATIIGNASGHYDEAFGQLLLEKLEAQDYRCAMTGWKLIPGINASIDHIVPKIRGGSLDDPNNLWWVDINVNYAKRQYTPEEFVDFCRAVLAFHEQKPT